MNTKFLAAAAFSAAISVSSSAFASILILPFDGGWYYDQVNSLRDVATIKFVVPAGDSATFSFTDGFIPGDVYKITLSPLSFKSLFTSFPTTFDNNAGPAAGPPDNFAADWLNNDFSHFQFGLTAGAYSITVQDTIMNEGFPAGFGVRVDGVPEASTWAMLGAGFAAIGLVGLSRRRRASRYAL
jgi:hypothetical protein